MLVIVVQVVLRYAFGLGSIMLRKSSGTCMPLASCSACRSPRCMNATCTTCWLSVGHSAPAVDRAVGLCGFLLGFSLVVVWSAVPFVVTSWQLGEVSAAPGPALALGACRSWSPPLRCWHWPGWAPDACLGRPAPADLTASPGNAPCLSTKYLSGADGDLHRVAVPGLPPVAWLLAASRLAFTAIAITLTSQFGMDTSPADELGEILRHHRPVRRHHVQLRWYRCPRSSTWA